MTRYVRAASILVVLCCGTLSGQIQVESGVKTLPLGPDTLCFRYTFELGDSLLYHVKSEDSLFFFGKPPLIKSRQDLIMVSCDSVISPDVYRIRITMIGSNELQTSGSDTVERNTSPWIGRTATLVIDSIGNRIKMWNDDASNATMSPGGPFQPLLLPTLGESCGRQNQSWLFQDTTALVENSVPPAVYENATLWRVIDRADTLGRKFFQIQYTQTGIGTLQIHSESVKMDVQTQVASFGKLSMDSALKVPFHLYAASQNRLTITTPQGEEMSGKQFVTVHVSLLEAQSSNKRRRFSSIRR